MMIQKSEFYIMNVFFTCALKFPHVEKKKTRHNCHNVANGIMSQVNWTFGDKRLAFFI